MSGIVGIVGARGASEGRRAAALAVAAAMPARGCDRSAFAHDDVATLGATGHEWEWSMAHASGDAVPLVDEGDVVVVADAALYYRQELRRRLETQGVQVSGESAAQLIAAAYRAWGARCAEWLEGDFAFLVWDRKTRRLCAARDFTGKRPLFYMQSGEAIIVASTIGGILTLPGCEREVNLAAVAAVAGGLFAASDETSYRGVRALAAGQTLEWGVGAAVRLSVHWQPPECGSDRVLPFDEAADALAELLRAAVRERLAPEGDTTVWLSGGWDSTAVFGHGRQVLRNDGATRRLLPVSMSYPEGDSGREDELISDAAAFWDAPVEWLDIAGVPFFADPAAQAATRDEPFGHPFESWLRALARGSRSVGARVALEGVGGDQLFQVSDVFLADLLRTGRWMELAREWRGRGMPGGSAGARAFFNWAVQPLLPRPALAAATRLRRGRPLSGYLERSLAPWIDKRFAAQHGLEARERAATPGRRGASRAAYEMEWYLTHPFYARIFASASAVALSEGVEIRSPLLDARVVRFAASRPRAERASGRETKRLLRHAARTVMPAGLLAPRAHRTGTLDGYFDRSMRSALPALLEDVLGAPMLAEAGIIDPAALRRSGEAYLAGAVGGEVAGQLYFTMMAEWWLRAHSGRGRARLGASSDRMVCC